MTRLQKKASGVSYPNSCLKIMIRFGRVIISCLNIFNLNKEHSGMENEFYVTLLSNSSKNYYPENKTSDFTVHLTKEVNLDGKWCVALSEITFPSMLHNVSSGNNGVFIHYKSFDDTEDAIVTWKPVRINIPPGAYKSVSELTQAINLAVREYTGYKFDLVGLSDDEQYVKITNEIGFQESLSKTFSNALEKTILQPTESGVSSVEIGEKPKQTLAPIEDNCQIQYKNLTGDESETGGSIEFEGRLALQLGFVPKEKLKFGQTAADPPYLILGIPPEIFVYIDLVESQIISDSSSQVVRIVKTLDNDKTAIGGIISREFTHRNYLSIVKNRFQTIQVELRDTTGKFIPFHFGTSSATLHFKKCS